jgi:hypothetical protein
MRDDVPRCDSIEQVDAEGYFLTHAIWRNGMGSYQPETGVRSHAAGLKDFRLIQHGCDDWPLVTRTTLRALVKGWDECKIADVIGWLHSRNRKRRTRQQFSGMHDRFVKDLRSA